MTLPLYTGHKVGRWSITKGARICKGVSVLRRMIAGNSQVKPVAHNIGLLRYMVAAYLDIPTVKPLI